MVLVKIRSERIQIKKNEHLLETLNIFAIKITCLRACSFFEMLTASIGLWSVTNSSILTGVKLATLQVILQEKRSCNFRIFIFDLNQILDFKVENSKQNVSS